jgi:prepilin-type N-terminal cleavage/methylation domain-containing protein
MKRGYTLIEVMMALVILGILAVPLGYVLSNTGSGSARARQLDQSLTLAQEAWTITRATDPDSLRDTSWDRDLSGDRWRISRDVFDSADRASAGLPTIQRSAALRPPVEIAVCAAHARGEDWDTVKCFRWLRPSTRIVP